jgi:gliding motility-associated-like protein
LYLICQGETASLQVQWQGGEAMNVQWYRFISTSNTWTPVLAQTQVLQSTYNATPGGFRVVVRDINDEVVFEDICWVSRINSPPIVNANTLQPGCGQVQLSGLYIAGNITGYYNPPPANFEEAYLFNANSEIELCLNITHPILSDLVIELVSPEACGSQVVLLTESQTPEDPDSICYNSDALGLCFSNTSTAVYDLCSLDNFDVGGVFGAFGVESQAIDWTPLIGCDVTQPGWSINIRDCYGGANGSLVSATLTIDENVVSGSPLHQELLPVAEQSFTILDTGCDSSLYTNILLERVYPQATLLSQGIGIAWETSPPIELPNNGVGLNLLLNPGPTQDVYFTLRLSNVELNNACGAISSDTEFFDYIQPDSSVISLSDSILCIDDAAILLTSSIDEGVWNGPVQVTEEGAYFNPATVGTGTWTIAYDPVSSCIDPTEVTVLVDVAPQLSLTIDNTYCNQDTVVILMASPLGGYWTGDGVIDSVEGIFNPSLIVGDSVLLTYSVEGNCPIENSMMIGIEAFVQLQIIGSDTSLCEESSAVNLSTNLPQVFWEGDGITNIGEGIFNPSIAGIGEHLLVANYDEACSSRDTIYVVVEASAIQFSNPSPVCVNADPVDLNVVATPGVWTGLGVIDAAEGIVDPALLGVGVHYVSYTLNNSCATQDSVALSVEDFPEIQIGLPEGICVDQSDFVLLANYEGGVFYGDGVYTFDNQWYFTPQLAGVGSSVVNYAYSDVCTLTVLDSVDVYPLPELEVVADTSICPEGEAFLSVSGAFSYGWAPAATLDTPQQANTIAQPDNTTTYTVAGESIHGCFSSAEVTVEVFASPQVTTNGPLEICPDESIVAEALGIVTAQWSGPAIESPTELSTFVSPTQTTTYDVTGFDENGCSGEASVDVIVHQPAAVFSASDTLGTPPLEVVFTNFSNGDYFIWDFGNGDSLITENADEQPISTFVGEGVSVVTLTAFLNGCPATFSLGVETYYDSELLVVPNVVSPNGDGKNDIWRVETRNMDTMRVDIFNRWGALVQTLEGINASWSPRYMSTGTYYFRLLATGLDGETYNREGHITVLISEN